MCVCVCVCVCVFLKKSFIVHVLLGSIYAPEQYLMYANEL